MMLGAAMAAAVLAAALLREFWIHVWIPATALSLRSRGHPERALALLERGLRIPSLLGDWARAGARYRLSWLYMEGGRYVEAALECRRALTARLSPAAQAGFRLRLADCLEAVGERDEAEDQRRRAAMALDGAPARKSPAMGVGLARARLLADTHQYTEACAAYRNALALVRREGHRGRRLLPETLVRLALASLHAGRPAEAVRSAEEALRCRPIGRVLLEAHVAAGLGCAYQGLLDDADRHRQEAFRLAARFGDQERGAHLVVQLADVSMRRGRLVEALQDCEKASGMSLSARRLARLTEAECLRLWGRCDPARTALEQAVRAPGPPQPAEESRSRASLALARAGLEAEDNHPEYAWRYLEEARPELVADERFSNWHLAASAWVLALLGRSEEAHQNLEALDVTTARQGQDFRAVQFCTAMAARTCEALEEFDAARQHWQTFLDARPDPVFQPTGLYHLAECCLRLNEPDTAREVLERAVDLGIDSADARKARRRLEEILGPKTSES